MRKPGKQSKKTFFTVYDARSMRPNLLTFKSRFSGSGHNPRVVRIFWRISILRDSQASREGYLRAGRPKIPEIANASIDIGDVPGAKDSRNFERPGWIKP